MPNEKKKYKKIIKRDKTTGEIIDEQIVEIKDNEPIQQGKRTKYTNNTGSGQERPRPVKTNRVNVQRPSDNPPASNNNFMKILVIGLLLVIIILLIVLLAGRNNQRGADNGRDNTETEIAGYYGDTDTDEFFLDTETSEFEFDTETPPTDLDTETETPTTDPGTETENTANAGAEVLPQGPYDFANEPNGEYREIIYDSLDVAFEELSDVYYEDVEGQAVYYLYPKGNFQYTVSQMPELYENQQMQESWNYMIEALQQMNGEFAQILEEDITLHVVDPDNPNEKVITIVNDQIEYDLLQDLLGTQL